MEDVVHQGRIFGIGLNKTGTRSLAMALRMLGYRTMHKGGRATSELVERAVADGVPLLTYLDAGFDAYLDVASLVEHFAQADAQYPGSKFILTTRDEKAWLSSRAVHVGAMKGQPADVGSWRKERAAHHAAVADHFRARPGDLLELDIARGDGWDVLAPFLGAEPPRRPFPWENREGAGTYRADTARSRLQRRLTYARGRVKRRLSDRTRNRRS